MRIAQRFKRLFFKENHKNSQKIALVTVIDKRYGPRCFNK
jgi:hypothetical protein